MAPNYMRAVSGEPERPASASRLSFDAEIAPEITNLISQAKQFLYLVSPYNKDWSQWGNLTRALEDAFRNKAHVTVIYRKDQKRKIKAELDWLEQKNATVVPVETLHAKIYISETAALLTSMNLSQFSQANSLEACARFEKSEPEFAGLLEYVKKLVSRSAPEKPPPSKAAMPKSATAATPPSRSAPQAPRQGHCIYCRNVINFDEETPYCEGGCDDPKRAWRQLHCHACGRRAATTRALPLGPCCSPPAPN